MKILLSLYCIMLCSITLARSDFQSPIFSLSDNKPGKTNALQYITINSKTTLELNF